MLIFGRVLSGLHIEAIFRCKPVFGTRLGVVGATSRLELVFREKHVFQAGLTVANLQTLQNQRFWCT